MITAALANDTGISSTDSITSDPTITGLANDPSGVEKFQVSIDGGAMIDATSFLTGEGFTLTAADLATLNGGTAIPDGSHAIRTPGDRQPGESIQHLPRVLQPREHAAVTADRCAVACERSDRNERHDHEGSHADGADVSAGRNDCDAVHEWCAGGAANRDFGAASIRCVRKSC